MENIPQPPKWVDRIVKWRLSDSDYEDMLGDMHELYEIWVAEMGVRNARFQYLRQAMGFIRPLPVRIQKQLPELPPSPIHTSFNPNPMSMLRNYFKVTFRNLTRNKGYSFINIGGLAIGMAVAMLIGLWVYDEISFNSYHKNHHSIARVLRNGTANGETFTVQYLPYSLGEELRTKYGANFKQVLMAWAVQDHILSVGDKVLSQKGEFIDASAPEVFSLKMLKGNYNGLKDPHSIFLSESFAKALFGGQDPMGKVLQIKNYSAMEVKVTGVYKDLPHNSHFAGVQFFAPWDLFVSVNSWMTTQGFKNNFLDIYVQLAPHTTFEKASLSIKDAILNNIRDDKEYVSFNPQIFLHPMDKWHLYSEWKNGANIGGMIQYVWLFGIIGAFVLILACINFMNLSTARSEKRAKEVGVRKAIGSERTQLIWQFFSESFLIVILAFVICLGLASIAIGFFNDLADKQIVMPWSNTWFWLISLIFILFTGLIAGSYPALYLSSFHPVKVLKGTFRVGRFASTPRKVLVVAQFTVSVTLVIGTLIVYQQIQYAKNRPVGYKRDGLLMVQMKTAEFYTKYDAIKDELNRTGVVAEMAQSSSPVTNIWSSNGGFSWRGKNPSLQTDFATLTVAPTYGKTVGWQFVAGRDFSQELASDSTGFVINEAALKFIGLKQPIGEVVTWAPSGSEAKNYRIIGVIKDMVMVSPFDQAVPTVFYLDGNLNWINIRFTPHANTSEALSKIEAVFKKFVPSAPFNYTFADQEYALKFAAEEQIGTLASVFASLAIFISCLGLFGLASFVAEQRTKEIGIRKVLGATILSLWQLLSREFIVLVLIAFAIATPLAWYFLNDWLAKYQYHTRISWWIFAVTGMGALLITLLTVSFQAIKAALINPVKSLRNE
ncbi:ABC transporter permease [Cytophagaceae bacterium YF14B1]|uniref:ABC transporter permease n=1 Tax=Xanthocytophaga flava TaxID=3048013 RepID=A0AAE3QTR5_9BACT|nr:ABC transporter permease [Xanthocytophaga flavus]MDJ1484791.1 ABC transporter permease [Xanthocytophaga flavus]